MKRQRQSLFGCLDYQLSGSQRHVPLVRFYQTPEYYIHFALHCALSKVLYNRSRTVSSFRLQRSSKPRPGEKRSVSLRSYQASPL